MITNARRSSSLRSLRNSFSTFLLFLSLLGFAGAGLAAPASGYWWNPAEPGRGFVIEITLSSPGDGPSNATMGAPINHGFLLEARDGYYDRIFSTRTYGCTSPTCNAQ